MFKVGLTGGMGSGKSTVSKRFEQLGIAIIDADCIAKSITEPGQAAFEPIIKHFGSTLLESNGYINRKKLRALIFSNSFEKKWLEDLLHPMILNTMKEESEKAQSPYCLLVIPLLQETKASHALIDRVLVVDAPIHLQLQRIEERDHINEAEAKKMLDTQATQKERLAMADDVIINDAGKDKLQAQINSLHTLYLELSKT